MAAILSSFSSFFLNYLCYQAKYAFSISFYFFSIEARISWHFFYTLASSLASLLFSSDLNILKITKCCSLAHYFAWRMSPVELHRPLIERQLAQGTLLSSLRTSTYFIDGWTTVPFLHTVAGVALFWNLFIVFFICFSPHLPRIFNAWELWFPPPRSEILRPLLQVLCRFHKWYGPHRSHKLFKTFLSFSCVFSYGQSKLACYKNR